MPVIEVTSGAERERWQCEWQERLLRLFGESSDNEQWVRHQATQRLSHWDTVEHALFRVDGGWVALSARDPRTWQLVDLWIEPEERGRGYGRAALRAAIVWAATKAERLMIAARVGDAAVDKLLAPWPVQATDMVKPIGDPPVLGSGVAVRPLRHEEFAAWKSEFVGDYAQQIASSGMLPPAEAREKSETEHAQLLPDGVDTAGHTFSCVESDGSVVARLWLGHASAPSTTWVYRVEVEASQRGKGFGRTAMLAAEGITLGAGDTQLGLNVFGHNHIALSLYRSVGYRTVRVVRTVPLGQGEG